MGEYRPVAADGACGQRSLEYFRYDWWPIRAEARLFDRLAAMPVRIKYPADLSSEAWRRDWPAVAAGGGSAERGRRP